MKTRIKRIKRILSCIIITLLLVTVALLIVFRNELKTLSTLTRMDDGMYRMTYSGDYGFDDFLKTGTESDKDIERFVTKRLLHGLPIHIDVADAGCTAFVARDKDGDILFARNFDFEYAPSLQLYTKPDNGYASVSTVNLSFAGYSMENLPGEGIGLKNFLTLASPYLPFDGMNEKGVAIALLAVPEADLNVDEKKITLNTTTLIRLVLDKAATVDEAISLIKQYNIYFSGGIYCHYLLADTTGTSVIIEFYGGEVKVVEPQTDYQIASNFIAYNDLMIGEGFNEIERYEIVKEVLDSNDSKIETADAVNLLNEVGIYYEGIDKLQWSVIYNLSDLTGKYWTHRNIKNAVDFELVSTK